MSRSLGWVVVCVAGVLAWAGPARGVPWGYAAGTVHGTDGGVSALAYASDGTLYVTFHEPQYGVAPGQAAVFYDKEIVLGGGWIKTSF